MRRLLISVALVGLLATACGDDTRTGNAGTSATTAAGNEVTPSSSASTTPPDTASPEQVAAAPAALQFSAPMVGGGELDLRSFAGQTVALWFWAPT